MKTTKWLKHNFESSSTRTPEWMQFFRDFRSDLKQMLIGTDWELSKIINGHFFISAFLYNKRMSKYVYISISDVRFFQDEWHTHLLIRTAENLTDYHGGINNYCIFYELPMILLKFS